jgi:Rrf2 family protein
MEVDDMKISTKGRYGLRVMLDLATYGADQHVPLREISERQNITIKYLEQVITPLLRAGYVTSFRGNSGGYQLNCDPAKVTVGEIIRTMEGSLAPVSCLEGDENICPQADKCVTLPIWKNLETLIEDYLDSITLSAMMEGDHETCPLTQGTRNRSAEAAAR